MATKEEILKQIREAADRGVAVRVEPLASAVQELRAGVDALVARANALAAAVPSAKDVLPEGPIAALLESLVPPPAPVAAGFDWKAYKEGIRAIDSAKTQVDALNAYLTAASGFAHRVALFVLKGDRVAGWKGKGFSSFGASDDVVRTIALVPADDPHVSRVFGEERTIYVSPTGSEPLFARLPGPHPTVAALVPMTIKDKVAAFLYADRVEAGTTLVEFNAVEVLTLLTTLAIDSLATRKKIPSPSLTAAADVPEGAVVVAAPPPVELAEAEAVVEPVVAKAPPVAVPVPEPAPAPKSVHPGSIAPPSQPRISITIPSGKEFRLEDLPKPAAPKPAPPVPPPAPPAKPAAPIAMTFDFQAEPAAAPPPPPAPKPAPAPAAEEKGEPPAKGGGLLGGIGGGEGKSTQFIPPAHLVKKTPGIGASAPPPMGMSADEAKRHDDARRFARLLVSEIKLYNEAKISEGRRGGNLYDKLKDDIDRSRQMFDDRVPEEIRTKTNYFYEELVRILADGKPEVLGI
jgi:hypothetical protein